MKKLRIVAFLLVLCMFSTLLLACNSSDEGDDTTAATTQGTNATTNNNQNNNTDNNDDNNNSGNNNGGNNNGGNNNGGNNGGSTVDENEVPLYIYAVDEDYNGRPWDIDTIELGQGSYMHIMKDTNLEEYNAFKKVLEDEGAYLYDTNQIGENRYATYISKYQIINVMYLVYDYDENDTSLYPTATSKDHNEVRIIIDDREYFDLPTREQDNVYSADPKVTPLLVMLSDNKVTWPGRMGYLYQLADGSFYIIDGGYWGAGNSFTANAMKPNESSSVAHTIMQVLKAHAPDPENIVIAGWLITHTHEDHLGAMVDISLREDYRSILTVETFIHNTPTDDELRAQNSANALIEIKDRLNEAIERLSDSNTKIIKAHAGQKIYLRDLMVEIYTSQSVLLYSDNVSTGTPYTSIAHHNDTSILSRVYYQDTEAMYFGDTRQESNRLVINPVYRKYLDCDMLQVAHHGYGDTNSGWSYKHLTTPPKMVLWPDCRGHYDNKNPDGTDYYEGGKLYTGVKYVGFNKDAFFQADGSSKPGVTQVYLVDNTCAVITDFKNLNSYEMVDYVPANYNYYPN